MVILGGAGSIPGVVIGAITINVVLELLRDPDDARTLFYVAIALGLVALIRPWQRLAAVLGGTLVFGVVVYQLADRLRPEWVSGSIEGGRLASLVEGWVVHPAYSTRFGNIGFVLLIAAVLVLSELRGALAHGPARADALPRGLRLGEPARRGAERDADPPPRRAADRADDLAAAGPARHARVEVV